jgi:hypothetical protein
MAYLHEGIEKVVDESMPFLYEKLGDLSPPKKHRCFTLAQCAILLCMHNNVEKPDRTEDATTFVMLALKDVAHGKLQVLHPETLLPWSEYLEMIKAGMYGKDNPLYAPVVTAGWLVHIDEAEKWYRSKGLAINLSEVRSDLDKLDENNTSQNQTAEETKNDSLNHESSNQENWCNLFDEDQCSLFDPLTKKQIKVLFTSISKEDWADYFERAKRNGLFHARQTPDGVNQYNPARVADWLIGNGHCRRDHAIRLLAKNLPPRSIQNREYFLDSWGLLDEN